MTTDELTVDPELDRRLRRTLRAVAETVEDAPDVAASSSPPDAASPGSLSPRSWTAGSPASTCRSCRRRA